MKNVHKNRCPFIDALDLGGKVHWRVSHRNSCMILCARKHYSRNTILLTRPTGCLLPIPS